MSESVRFRVDGELPPKKDGASSMWKKPLEAVRLRKLRAAARNAFGDRPPLSQRIELTLEVHVPRDGRTHGDLDNFITGVCDGLQAAPAGTPWQRCDVWSDPGLSGVLPDVPVGILDDNAVTRITGKKISGDCAAPWYEVVLEGD